MNRLGNWLTGQLALAILLVSIAAYAVSALIVASGIDFIERERLAERLERAAENLREAAESMVTSTRDYSAWDDTYAYIANPGDAFLDANFHAESADLLGVDWVAFVGPEQRLLHARQLRARQAQPAIGAALAQQLERLTHGLHPARRDEGGQTLLWDGDRPVLVSYAAITNSARSVPPLGWLLFGRELVAGARGMPGGGAAIRFDLVPAQNARAAATEIRQEDGHWVGWRPLAPWPAAIVLREGPAYAAQRAAVLTWLALSSAGIAVLSLAGLSWLFRRKVLKRLELFAALAGENAQPGAPHRRWPVHGSDEIDLLGGALNEMLDRIGQHDRLLAHLASHDPLTALGNRRQLMERLQSATALFELRPELCSSLVLADLDKLKSINDVFGPPAGDRVLTVVAERIQALLRGGDLAVRLGGDEFAVLLADARPEHAQAYCERLAERLNQAIVHDDQFLFVTASIGIAGLEPGLNGHALLSRADKAMDRAKRSGGDRIVVFDPALDRPRELGEQQAPAAAAPTGIDTGPAR